MGKTNKKVESEYKKPKHGKLGEKINKREFNDDEQIDIAAATNTLDSEFYCGNCENFNTEDCPYRDEVDEDTLSEIDVHCENYWD